MIGILPKPARFVPYRELSGVPNIIVDGAPAASTVLCLSHWPNNATPAPLKRDTSTETVFAYLDMPALHRPLGVVSNNHFDEDGLFSMFALVRPDLAVEHRQFLIDAARAGDFGVYQDRSAARLCFAVEAYTDPQLSPLPRDTFTGCDRQQVAALYRNMLDCLPGLLADLPSQETWWREQDSHLADSESLIASGRVHIEELPEFDLAVVHIPPNLPPRPVRRYLQWESAAVHPFAIHRATERSRLLRVRGSHYEFQYRYESWVQLTSRRPQLRVDLQPLCERLTMLDAAAGTWRCEPVTDVAPRMFLAGGDNSALSVDTLVAELSSHLASAPVAWDPYDWQAD